MPFGAHETMEVHEILNEKINMINHFGLYAQFAQNQQLQQMLGRHSQIAMQGYDQLVGYTHDYQSAANRVMSPQAQNGQQPQDVQYGLHNPMQQAPQMQGNLNDNQIAWAMLALHKNSAKNHIAASLECADPNIRQMMIQGSVTCANFAYEVFMFMNQQGQYQIPTMQDHTAKTFLHSYQPTQGTEGMQQ